MCMCMYGCVYAWCRYVCMYVCMYVTYIAGETVTKKNGKKYYFCFPV